MALPRISELSIPQLRPETAQLAEASDRAGGYTIEQLETMLQPLLAEEPDASEGTWSPQQTLAFVATTSSLLWFMIAAVVLQFF